ncbi:MAG TPA: hypothetical protein VHT27_04425 [Solirubrobacteraceae bacterium]|jgi:hypothetical protein|nr:hypothetical protein [Solirubrobacteraceae bacterium]
MLHVATVHYRSPRWIEIQTRYLREKISAPFQTWTSLEGIDPSYGCHFDHVVEQLGPHAGKLNHLAMEISTEASDEDLLMFLDGDAFPIADPMPVLDAALARAPLVAVRRAENLDEPQPHPCFCVTTVGTWRTLPGDWSAGPAWRGPRGQLRTDVGGALMRRLELTDTPWEQLLRTNRHDLDPIFFAVYGDIVYHHGSGFRKGGPSGVHKTAEAPTPLPAPPVPGLARAVGTINRRRWQAWEGRTQGKRLDLSEQIYERISSGDESWLTELM